MIEYTDKEIIKELTEIILDIYCGDDLVNILIDNPHLIESFNLKLKRDDLFKLLMNIPKNIKVRCNMSNLDNEQKMAYYKKLIGIE